MTNHPNRKQPRYQVRSWGYITEGVCGNPGDIGAGYDRLKIISEHSSKIEAEAACADARRPSKTIIGTNSSWVEIEEAFVHDRFANR